MTPAAAPAVGKGLDALGWAAVLLFALAAAVGSASSASSSPLRAEVVWRPNPGPQESLISCPIEDVLFGGARGGGKTAGLLGDFLSHASKYGASAKGILFRLTYDELTEVVEIAEGIYGPLQWKYNRQTHAWRSPEGAVLWLRYFESETDYWRYHGKSFTWMAFDELNNWASPRGIDLLWSCLRSANGVPCLRRSTCNPGGPGHQWVKERYRLSKDVCHPYQPFRYSPLKERPDLSIECVFIPSRLEDNPRLDAADYERRLAASSGGGALFKAWREGDWDVIAGQYFEGWSEDEHTFDPARVVLEPWYTRWISVDWGRAHNAAVLWHAYDGRTIYTYREHVASGRTPAELAEEIVERSAYRDAYGRDARERILDVYLSPDAFREVDSPKTIADQMSEVLSRGGLPRAVAADDDRIGGWNLLTELLRTKGVLVSKECPRLIAKVPLASRDPKRLEDVLKTLGDDEIDAWRYAVKTRPRRASPPREVVIEEAMTSRDPTVKEIQAQMAEARVRKDAGRVLGTARATRRRRM